MFLTQFSQEWDVSHVAANQALIGVASDQIHQVLLDACCNVEAAYTKLEHAEAFIYSLERWLGIEECWTTEGDKYWEYQHEAILADYEDALDKLECLVVQRLFELSKLGLSETGMFHNMYIISSNWILSIYVGYKLWHQIGRALQWWSEVIWKALSWYNTQAAKLVPPCLLFTWKEIV